MQQALVRSPLLPYSPSSISLNLGAKPEYEARKAALLCLIESAMGKAAVAGGIPAQEDADDGDDED